MRMTASTFVMKEEEIAELREERKRMARMTFRALSESKLADL